MLCNQQEIVFKRNKKGKTQKYKVFEQIFSNSY